MEVTLKGYNYYPNKHCLNFKLIIKLNYKMFFSSSKLYIGTSYLVTQFYKVTNGIILEFINFYW